MEKKFLAKLELYFQLVKMDNGKTQKHIFLIRLYQNIKMVKK